MSVRNAGVQRMRSICGNLTRAQPAHRSMCTSASRRVFTTSVVRKETANSMASY